jgi:hypothetical protein
MTTTTDRPAKLLNGERLMTLAQACCLLPGTRGNDKLNPSTLTRRILKGTKGVNGQVVKLEAVRIPWHTRRCSLDRRLRGV